MGSSKANRWIIALFWIAASAPLASGQAPKAGKKAKEAPKSEKSEKSEKPGGKPVADQETTSLLDKFDAQTYTLEGEGVKSATCNGNVEVTLPGQPPIKGEFKYVWDVAANDRKGKFTFSDPNLEAQLKGMNMIPPLDNAVRRDDWREIFAGCRLTSKKVGGNTVVQVVEGKSKEGLTSVTVNDKGHPVEAEMGGGGPGAPSAAMKITNVAFGEKFSMSKTAISLAGTPVAELTCEYAKVNDYNAPSKMTNSISFGGQNITSVVTLRDWKLQGSSGAEKKVDSPPAKGKKAEKGKAK